MISRLPTTHQTLSVTMMEFFTPLKSPSVGCGRIISIRVADTTSAPMFPVILKNYVAQPTVQLLSQRLFVQLLMPLSITILMISAIIFVLNLDLTPQLQLPLTNIFVSMRNAFLTMPHSATNVKHMTISRLSWTKKIFALSLSTRLPSASWNAPIALQNAQS